MKALVGKLVGPEGEPDRGIQQHGAKDRGQAAVVAPCQRRRWCQSVTACAKALERPLESGKDPSPRSEGTQAPSLACGGGAIKALPLASGAVTLATAWQWWWQWRWRTHPTVMRVASCRRMRLSFRARKSAAAPPRARRTQRATSTAEQDKQDFAGEGRLPAVGHPVGGMPGRVVGPFRQQEKRVGKHRLEPANRDLRCMQGLNCRANAIRWGIQESEGA